MDTSSILFFSLQFGNGGWCVLWSSGVWNWKVKLYKWRHAWWFSESILQIKRSLAYTLYTTLIENKSCNTLFFKSYTALTDKSESNYKSGECFFHILFIFLHPKNIVSSIFHLHLHMPIKNNKYLIRYIWWFSPVKKTDSDADRKRVEFIKIFVAVGEKNTLNPSSCLM